jgi:hypothetical protein
MRLLKAFTIAHVMTVSLLLVGAGVSRADADSTVHCDEGGAAACSCGGTYCSCDADSFAGCTCSCGSNGNYDVDPC